MSQDFTTPVTSPLHVDRTPNIGNTPGVDDRGRLHVKISNTNSEPLPVAITSEGLTGSGADAILSIDDTGPVIAKVGAGNLTGRMLLTIQPLTGKIRIGFSTDVSSTVGTEIAKKQIVSISASDLANVYICSENGSVDVAISEAA